MDEQNGQMNEQEDELVNGWKEGRVDDEANEAEMEGQERALEGEI